MALLTANPVTLNQEQILRADYVVTATVAEDGSQTISVEREWKQGARLEGIRVENLVDSGGKPGRRYLVPLSKSGGGRFRVTKSRLPDQSPLLYPATEEAHAQLKELLAVADRRRAQ